MCCLLPNEEQRFLQNNYVLIVGIMDEREVTRSFLESFEDGIMKDHVTFEEFEDYYEGLSLGVRDDEEFANILRNAWSVWMRNIP